MAELQPNLEKCIGNVVKCLRKGSIYSEELYVRYKPKAKRLSISNHKPGLLYNKETLEAIFEKEEVRSCEFHDLGRDVRKAKYIARFSSMLFNRIVMEIARKMPSPKFKNRLYRLMGVDIPEISEVIVAPNVFIDYIYPQLLSIGPGTFIGEEAILTAHFFTAKKFVIGTVEIGEDCMVGGRAMLFPGIKIGSGAEIYANSVVSRDLLENEVIKPIQHSYR